MHNIIIYLFVWILYSRVLGVLWHTTRTLVRARSTLTITYTYLPYFVFTTNSVDGQRGDINDLEALKSQNRLSLHI